MHHCLHLRIVLSNIAPMNPIPCPTRPQESSPTAPRPVAIDARSLFGRQPVVMIEHAGERYLLRVTRNGKLILTK